MHSSATDPYALAVDLGGTFVDFTLCNLRDGTRQIGKVLRQHGPVRGFLDAVDQAVATAGITTAQLSRIIHGTTLATNAVLERANPDLVVITTAGFEDVLEIGRHDAPRSGNVHRWVKPRRPVLRRRIVGLEERVHWDGAVELAPSAHTLHEMADRVAALKPSAVAIILMHAHAFPEHEKQMAAVLAERLPGVPMSLSHEVLAQAGEYERSTATILNAYVQPLMSAYIGNLLAGLEERGSRAPLYLMASDGGIMSAGDARQLPIKTVLSGPAAGAAGAAAVAAAMNVSRIFTLDVGGTSSDVACAQDGTVDVTTEGVIDAFPIATPILSIHTVGTGGGSIAAADDQAFSVGPKSAGAEPGPICYGNGGQLPTVTDAQSMLGRLPGSLAGGVLELDAAGARAGIEEKIAAAVGREVDVAAESIVRLANIHMANAIRKISTERGRDPRDYALFAFGGAGGAHAVEVAQLAGISQVVVPTHPGVFTTEGLLSADLTRDYVRTLASVPRLAELDAGELAELIAEMAAEGRSYAAADPAIGRIRTQASLDLRYVNQAFELTLPLPDTTDPAVLLSEVREDFHEAHRARYSYAFPEAEVEAVAVRVTVRGDMPHAPRPALDASSHAEPYTSRSVFFAEAGWVDTPAYRRGALGASARVAGPAVIDDYDSTIVIPPGAFALVHDRGELVVEVPPIGGTDEVSAITLEELGVVA